MAAITKWMSEQEEPPTVILKKNTMFLNGLHQNLSLKQDPSEIHNTLHDHIKTTIGWDGDAFDLVKQKLFEQTIQNHPKYKKISMIYRPFLLISVSVMIYLALMRKILSFANFADI